MTKLVAHTLAPLAVAFVLVTAAPSLAQVVHLSGPEAFSGSETQLDFEDPTLFEGAPVTQFADVAIGVQDAAGNEYIGAGYSLSGEPREFGSQAPGSINNFGAPGLPFPYPMIRLGFPDVVHRVAFAARVNVLDAVVVTFRLGGEVVGQASRPSPSTSTFHFHGYELASGFDELLVGATSNFSGAMGVDNLYYEALAATPPDPGTTDPPGDEPPDSEPPTADVPVFVCEGFYKPGSHGHRGKGLAHGLLRHLPYKLLSAALVDSHGVVVGWQDLTSAPVMKVLHTPVGADATQDITDHAVLGDSTAFRYREKRGLWKKMLRRKAFRQAGTYVVTMESGDASEYAVDSCVEWIVIEPPPARHRGHSWMRRWHKKLGGDD